MKAIKCLSLLICCLGCVESMQAQTFNLIPKSTGRVDPAVIRKLTPSLRGLAAYYSAVGGTICRDQSCLLTTALGLGHQGSQEQISLIQQYFPDDKVAKMVCGQNCYLPPDSSVAFSDFIYLSFAVSGNDITVNYKLSVYDHGHVHFIQGPDVYTYQNKVFKRKKRVLYAWIDK